jgi:hypothetical protein
VVFLNMVFNVAIEAAVGTIPFVGDIFDMTWKAKLRNVQLLEKYIEHPQKTKNSYTIFHRGYNFHTACIFCYYCNFWCLHSPLVLAQNDRFRLKSN